MTDTDTPNLPREWEYKEFIARGMNGPDAAEDQQRARALATLRDKIRDAGHVIIPESLMRDEGTLITVTNPETAEWQRWDGTGQPDGTMYRWTASATERGTDTGDILPLASERDQDGRLWFAVPAPMSTDGGDVRLRHNLGGEVTVWGWNQSGSPDEPFTKSPFVEFAAGISDDVVTVTLLAGGTALLSVEKDPEPIEDTDVRLLWMLRVLADEFGPMGVIATAREMWPDAFKVAAAEPVAERTDEPTPG